MNAFTYAIWCLTASAMAAYGIAVLAVRGEWWAVGALCLAVGTFSGAACLVSLIWDLRRKE